MHNRTDRIAHTTAFDTPVVEHWLERDIAQWVHPMKDRSEDPSCHEPTLLPLCVVKEAGACVMRGPMSPRQDMDRSRCTLVSNVSHLYKYCLNTFNSNQMLCTRTCAKILNI